MIPFFFFKYSQILNVAKIGLAEEAKHSFVKKRRNRTAVVQGIALTNLVAEKKGGGRSSTRGKGAEALPLVAKVSCTLNCSRVRWLGRHR